MSCRPHAAIGESSDAQAMDRHLTADASCGHKTPSLLCCACPYPRTVRVERLLEDVVCNMREPVKVSTFLDDK